MLVIGVILLGVGGVMPQIFVSICLVVVGSRIIVMLNPCAACVSQRKASVFGAQIAVVSGLRSRTLRLWGAGLLQPGMTQDIESPFAVFGLSFILCITVKGAAT